MIIGFIGARGSGKSVSMVLEAYKYHKRGYQILSNIGLSFPSQPYTGKMMEQYASEKNNLRKAVVLIDEAHVLLDSRSSASKRNRIVSYFILQSRKRDVHIIYTTQSYHQIEKRLRDQTDLIVECSYNGDLKQVRQKAYDPVRDIERKRIVDVEGAFEMYDTNEIVDPFGDD